MIEHLSSSLNILWLHTFHIIIYELFDRDVFQYFVKIKFGVIFLYILVNWYLELVNQLWKEVAKAWKIVLLVSWITSI